MNTRSRTAGGVVLIIFFLLFIGNNRNATTKTIFAKENQLQDVIKDVMPATVFIETYDAYRQPLAWGSGFFINDKGELITNYHVINGAESAKIKTPDGNIYKITKVIAKNSASDLIKMQAEIGSNEVKFLTINKSLPDRGDVVIIGSPEGLESTVSDGIVSAVRDLPDFGSIIQTTAPISHGSSGSPVVNMKGEVIGVASAIMEDGQNLNFVVPAAKIIELNDDKQAPSITQNKDSHTQNDDIFSMAKFYYVKRDSKKAIYFLKQFLDTNPNCAEAWFYAGVCYTAAWFDTEVCYSPLRCYQEAIESFKESIRLNRGMQMRTTIWE